MKSLLLLFLLILPVSLLAQPYKTIDSVENDTSLPTFPEGMKSLQKFINENLKYPNVKDSLTGKVIVSFVVKQSGELENIKIVRGLGVEYDQATLNMIKKMPYWNPAKQNGRSVDCKYTLPIFFPQIPETSHKSHK